jgi:hypothetical protein
LHYRKRVDDENHPAQKATNPAGTGFIKSSCATRTTHLVEVFIMAHAIRSEQAQRLMFINYSPIRTRDDLSFTTRDAQERLVNWPRNNLGVAADWEKGMAFFDEEVSALAAFDETEAFHAIQFAIMGMGGRCTNLEIGFAQRIAAAAVLGLRAMRNGEADFVPVDREDN